MTLRPAILVIFAAATLGACKSPEQKAAEDFAKRMEEAGKQAGNAGNNPNLGDAMAAMSAALSGATGGQQVEPVDFRELRALLPESLPQMNRTSASGEKTAAMGMQISMAEGQYSSDQGGSLTLKISDIGSMSGMAGMTAYAWAATDYDRDTGSGYEKTTTFNGYKAHEKYDRDSKSGEMSVLVGNRFVVEADGDAVDMNSIKGALSRVDLKKLEGLK